MEKRGFKGRRQRPPTTRSGKKYPKSANPVEKDKGPYGEYPCPYDTEELMKGSAHPSVMTIKAPLPCPPKSKTQLALPYHMAEATCTSGSPKSQNLKFLKQSGSTLETASPAAHTAIPETNAAFLYKAFGMSNVASPGRTPLISDLLAKSTQASAFMQDIHKAEEKRSQGFEQVFKSLEALFNRLKHNHSLSESWIAISSWLDQYHSSSDSHRLSHICGETLKVQYEVDAQRRRKHPNPSMTSLSLTILDQLLLLTINHQPSLAPVCRAVKRELVGAIYMSPPSSEAENLFSQQDAEHDPYTALLNLTEPYKAKKSYYSLTRELSNKMQQAETDILSEETKREKQLAVMDRVISYWQMEFQKLILKVWKMYFDRQKLDKMRAEEARKAAEQNTELQGQISILKCEVQALRNEFHRKTVEGAERLAEKDADIRALQETVSELTESNGEMTERLESMQESMNNIYKQEISLREEITSYQTVLENTIKCYMEGPKADVNRQEQFSTILGELSATAIGGNVGHTTSIDAVSEWVKRVDKKESVKDTCSADLENVTNIMVLPCRTVADFSVHYLRVLRFLAPHAIVEADFTRILDDPPKMRLDYFFELAGKSSVHIPFTSEDAATNKEDAQMFHGFIISALFTRFADAGLPGEWLRSDTQDKVPGPLWTSTPTTPEEWAARIREAWKRRAAWKELVSGIKYAAMKGATTRKKR